MGTEESGWFAVRCIFELSGSDDAHLYEERITLWQASSAEEAISRAETEATQYASDLEGSPDSYLGLAQSFHLFVEPADGAEVFSLLRESALPAGEYLNAFFDTGAEHQEQVGDEDRMAT
jgi:hypothetical protein